MATNGSNGHNGINGRNGTNGTNGANLDPVDILLKKVTQSVGTFKADGNEKDRLEAVKAAEQLVRALHEPKDNVYQIVYSPTQAMCVRIGIDLEIFATLSKATKPLSLKELAAVKNASPFIVERVLRILAGIEYVHEKDIHLYTPTRMTHQMADRRSIAMVKFMLDPKLTHLTLYYHTKLSSSYDFGMSSLAKIPEFLRERNYQFIEGVTSGPWQYAMNQKQMIWEWVAQSEERLDITNSFMEADRGSRPAWAEWFPVEKLVDSFEGGDKDVFFVDVAGGRGHEIEILKKKFPDAKGRFVLEDLPHVVEQAVPGLEAEKLGFDLFKPQPIKGARIYYMKFILHDWSDSQSLEILKHIRDAMKPGYSTLIIEEFVLPEKDCPLLPAMWDWEMMVFLNSFERSEGHWKRLLSEAGFETKFSYPPGDGQGIIQAEVKQ